ncbi:MAG: AarF/UbiB family protein [Caldilinea sp.]|nr:phage holin family protein [Anaerolineales bacterium]HRA66961.1 AarF/UbiB family protein [Caldilinea sp.]
MTVHNSIAKTTETSPARANRLTTVIIVGFHILIYALAVQLALWVLPGFRDDGVFGIVRFLLTGLVFGLLNVFLRPVLVLFTGRLIIRSFGLFVVVINAMLLAVLAWLGNWQVANVFTLLFGGLVIGIVLALLDALLGVNRPFLRDADEQPRLWSFLVRLSGNRSNQLIANLRFQQVYDLIYRYLLEIGLDRLPFVAPVRQWVGKHIYGDARTTISGLSTPAQVRVMLQELGPTFVKFGQMISSRAEALPDDWQVEFNKLQSNVPPFPGQEAVALVEKALGKPIHELYAEFAVEPFAAASTAQVHRAKLHDGADVVVKVQRPNIVPKIKADLQVLNDVLQTIAARVEWMRENDILGIFGEFANNLVKELDYRNEAFNARQLADTMSSFAEVEIPTMYREYTTANVLTMSYVEGVKIINVEKIAAAGHDPERLARTFLRVMIKQLIFDGYFHGDAHPGNILVSLETGKVIFLDMGMMGMLNQQQRINLADLIWVLNGLDAYEIAETLLRLCTPFHDVHVAQFREDIDRTVVRYMRYPEEAGSLSAVLNAVFEVLASNGLRLGSELTMALKTLIQAEAIVHTLDYWLDITREAFSMIQGFLAEQFKIENVKTTVQTQLMRSTKELVRRIPDLQQATMQWINQYEKGKFEVEVNTDDLNQRLDIFNVAAQRLAVGIILLGMIIGAGFATSMNGVFLGLELSSIAFLIFVFSILAGLVMSIRMMRTVGEKPQRRPRILYD